MHWHAKYLKQFEGKKCYGIVIFLSDVSFFVKVKRSLIKLWVKYSKRKKEICTVTKVNLLNLKKVKQKTKKSIKIDKYAPGLEFSITKHLTLTKPRQMTHSSCIQ